MNSKLSLRWRDHHSALITMLENHLDNSTLSDCVIAAEGQYIKAHKVVLSSCSPYFQLLFTLENEKNPIVVLKDVKFDDLKAVIDFVYRGEVQVFEDQLVTFLETAESLQIKGLGRNNNAERFGKKKKEFPAKRSRESSLSPPPEDPAVKRQAYEPEDGSLELVPVLEENQREGWKAKRQSYHSDVPSTSTSNPPPAYNFRSSTTAQSAAHGNPINIEISPALPEPSLSAEDCLAETDSVVKTESLSDSEMGQTEEYMDDALSEGADGFMRNDVEGMVGQRTGLTEEQAMMRSHYSGGPPQSDANNMPTDNSMLPPQITNSQDFMLGLGALDAASSGAVAGPHLSGEPSTSQGGVATAPQTAAAAEADARDPVAAVAAAAAAAVPPPPSATAPPPPPTQPPPPPPPPLPPPQPSLQMQLNQQASQMAHQMAQSISQQMEAQGSVGGGTDPAAALASLQGHPLAAVLADGEDDDEIQVIADMVHPVDPRELLLAGGGPGGGGGGGPGGGGGGGPGRPPMGGSMGGGARPGKKHCCPECDKAFAAPSLLERHRRVHTGERPFRCEMCDATFRQLDALKRHHNVHTAERPHKCDQCGNAFKTIDCLKRHQRIHTGERPYRCGVCEAAFSQSSALVYHIRIHTGERPYPCPDCGRSFIRKAVLQKHMRSIHGRFPGKL